MNRANAFKNKSSAKDICVIVFEAKTYATNGIRHLSSQWTTSIAHKSATPTEFSKVNAFALEL